MFVGQVVFDDDNHLSVPHLSKLGEKSDDKGPALADYLGKPFVAWTGKGNDLLNVMQLTPDGNGVDPIEPHVVKDGETAETGPALDANSGSPLIAWTGTYGPGTLYVARVGNPSVQSLVGQALVVNATDGDNNVTIKHIGATMEVTMNGKTTDSRREPSRKSSLTPATATMWSDVDEQCERRSRLNQRRQRQHYGQRCARKQ